MRYLTRLLLLFVISFNYAFAQKDVTQFMGIPVDGYKSEMKHKLISKGFTYDRTNDCFEGEFNGTDVNLYLVTNNNKVWRIMVCDKNSIDETNIKLRFNKLCKQFSDNNKYTAATITEKEFTISEKEDISYELIVNNKRYDAYFFQNIVPELLDTVSIQEKIADALYEKFTQEIIDNPTKKQESDIEKLVNNTASLIEYDLMSKKIVWFTIRKGLLNNFYISMYYDNMYNQANGEDL